MKTKAPARIEITAVAQVVAPLVGEARWNNWVGAVPIVANFDERARLHPLESEALTHLPHLQHVCHRPRLHLRVDEERVPVARARRIPARAAASLVAHPGDWEHRTLSGIRPSRVLATQVEDEWNLYENRMAARLVDHLLGWTSGRLDELRRLAAMVDEGHDFQHQTHGWHRRADRLFQLWARVFNDGALTQQLRRTLRTVEALQRSLQALLDSALYAHIPRSSFVPPALVPTNILVNDPHYRKVAALWRAWVRHGHRQEPTQEELRRRKQEDRCNFEAFVRLLVIQALDGLGYRPASQTVVSDTGAVVLQGPLGPATLRLSEGTLRFEVGSSALNIVPRPTLLDRENAPAMWRQIVAETGNPRDTAVLLLGRPEELALINPTAARAFGGWDRPRILLVSAWSLDCVERVARVLRGWDAPLRFASYPPRARIMPDPGLGLPPWLERVGPSIAVVRPAAAADRAMFKRNCDEREAVLKREQNDAQRAKRAFNPGVLMALDELRRLADRTAEIEPWCTCPVCESTPNPFQPRPASELWERWSWWCQCHSCSAEWGEYVCKSCAKNFPVLLPNVSWPALEGDAPPAGAVDRAFGRDLWAEPRLDQPGSRSFRCTRCGA